MELLDAIKIVLEFINDAEYTLESLDCTPEEWQQFDDAIERLQEEVFNDILVTNNLDDVIPDDGFSDGGEPYTDEELEIINKKG